MVTFVVRVFAHEIKSQKLQSPFLQCDLALLRDAVVVSLRWELKDQRVLWEETISKMIFFFFPLNKITLFISINPSFNSFFL